MAVLRLAATDKMPPQFVDCVFDDDTWSTPHPGGRTRHSWSRIELRNGTRLTSPVNSELLRASKRFLVLIALGGAVAGRRVPRGSSFASYFNGLRQLLIWMSGQHVFAFRDLTLSHVIGYRNFLQHRSIGKGAHKRTRGSEDTPSSVLTQAKLLKTVRYLVRLQSDMGDLGTRLDGYEVDDILNGIAYAKATPTKRIPDELFRRLINEAVRMVCDAGPTIAAFEAAYRDWEAARLIRQHDGVKTQLARFRKTTRSWVIRFAGADVNLAELTRAELFHVITVFRGACFAILAGLVGMRLSEIRSLKTTCLRRSVLRDGRVLLKVAGTLYKTSRLEGGEPAEWVAGWDEPENPVRSAIEMLAAISPQHSESHLFYTKGHPQRAIGNSQAAYLLSEFAKATTLDHEWYFHPHQFRKTFARFVALSGPNAAVALMRHFKHVSIQMTERYFPDDPELINDLIEASEELMAERLDSVFGADRLAGVKGEQIVARNSAYRGAAGEDARKSLVEMTMLDPSVLVIFHVYGVCLYEKDLAKCGGDGAKVGLESCMECPNSVVELEHLPFWSEQVDVIRANIAAHAADGPVDLEIYRQLERAEQIVRKLSA